MSTARDEGFTLLEILVVIFLIALLSAALTVGNVGALSNDLGDTAGELEAELRYASERAASTGTPHALTIDMPEQRFRLEQEVELPAEESSGRADALAPPRAQRGLQPVPSTHGRWVALNPDRVLIERVQIGSESYQAEVVHIAFGGDGSADAATVELRDAGGNRRTLAVLPFTAEVQLLDGAPADE